MKNLIIFIALFLEKGVTNSDPKNHKNWSLLRQDICGQVHNERIIGGETAPMNAYPWLIRIGYNSPEKSEIDFLCSGAIVNSQTVVTAAHCVANLPQNKEVKIIRVGEHNTETNPDCEDDFCADPVVDICPSEFIIPKNYNMTTLKNDIALIRLAEEIKFTAFVKPICLPYGELYDKDLVGTVSEVAGWGIINVDDNKYSNLLQVVKLPIINNEKCNKFLPVQNKIGESQLCLGGVIGKDSCGGDSGGPIMKVDDSNGEPRYYILGVVSYGSIKCGKTKMPGIYTKLTAYTYWLLDNLKQ